jgi:hypothetical protein
MKATPQLILYAVGGTFVLLLVYALRDYVVIGLVSAGAIYLYKLTTEPHDRDGWK